jgi:hypothetical protein
MTDRRAQMKRSKRRTSLAVYGVSAALFATVAGGLGVQMANGQDPAVGATKTQVAQVQPRKVLVRKVIVTKHITVIKPAPAATTAASSGQTYSSAPAPVQTYSAPAQTYSAPAAPAPAPAPVATATS